jgi:GT2 family glycosyltransferase
MGSPALAANAEVTVVIPTFNRARDIARVLRELHGHEGLRIDVIVVDNSSTDDTGAVVREAQQQWGDRLTYVLKEPQGPAAARERGLSMSRAPYVLFHDSDVQLQPGWIAQAHSRMERDASLGAIGGHIVYAFEPERVNAYGGDLGRFGLAWDVDEGSRLAPDRAEAPRIWINCSAMLVRRDAAVGAGGFDPAFFYGYEDSDLGWRLRIAGWGVRVVPELIAHHHVEPSPGHAHPEIVFHYCKNRLRMLIRNTQARRLPFVLAAYAAYTLADMVLRAPRAPKLKALMWNLANLRSTLLLRRGVQAHRRAADADIFASGSGRWFPPKPLAGRRRRPVDAPAGHAALGGAADDRV